MPDHYPEFPTGEQVYDYLQAYAKHFGVFERVYYRSEVIRITPRADAVGWRLHVRGPAAGSNNPATETTHDFDFVVVCNGVFATPNVPEFLGVDAFRANGGVVLHSSQLQDTKLLDGRDVVVVGFGKSALDIADAALSSARSSAIVCRRVPWKVPHRVWGRININHFILSRFTEIWFPHPNMRGAKRVLHRWFRPLVKAYWWVAEQVIGRQIGMSAPPLRPDTPLAQAGGCLTLTWDNLAALRDGRIEFHRGEVAKFVPSGIVLTDGRILTAQAVVLRPAFGSHVRSWLNMNATYCSMPTAEFNSIDS